MNRSARDVVKAYIHDVWNDRDPDLLREICANPLIRHYSGKRVEMTHDEQVARIRGFLGMGFVFDELVVHDDGEFVTSIWNSVGDGGAHRASGIEVFRVVDGRIAEVWNGPYGEEHWG